MKCDELKPRYLNMFDKFGLLGAGVYIVRSIGAKPIATRRPPELDLINVYSAYNVSTPSDSPVIIYTQGTKD